jgi:hypothetical protein
MNRFDRWLSRRYPRVSIAWHLFGIFAALYFLYLLACDVITGKL